MSVQGSIMMGELGAYLDRVNERRSPGRGAVMNLGIHNKRASLPVFTYHLTIVLMLLEM